MDKTHNNTEEVIHEPERRHVPEHQPKAKPHSPAIAPNTQPMPAPEKERRHCPEHQEQAKPHKEVIPHNTEVTPIEKEYRHVEKHHEDKHDTRKWLESKTAKEREQLFKEKPELKKIFEEQACHEKHGSK